MLTNTLILFPIFATLSEQCQGISVWSVFFGVSFQFTVTSLAFSNFLDSPEHPWLKNSFNGYRA